MVLSVLISAENEIQAHVKFTAGSVNQSVVSDAVGAPETCSVSASARAKVRTSMVERRNDRRGALRVPLL
jgi:hypothetical protein